MWNNMGIDFHHHHHYYQQQIWIGNQKNWSKKQILWGTISFSVCIFFLLLCFCLGCLLHFFVHSFFLLHQLMMMMMKILYKHLKRERENLFFVVGDPLGIESKVKRNQYFLFCSENSPGHSFSINTHTHTPKSSSLSIWLVHRQMDITHTHCVIDNDDDVVDVQHVDCSIRFCWRTNRLIDWLTKYNQKKKLIHFNRFFLSKNHQVYCVFVLFPPKKTKWLNWLVHRDCSEKSLFLRRCLTIDIGPHNNDDDLFILLLLFFRAPSTLTRTQYQDSGARRSD